ncbi:hypothetical protein ACFL6U_20055 [Planctomycetota bacterium]
MNTVCPGGGDQTGCAAPQTLGGGQHMWDLDRFTLSWLKPPLARSFTFQDYMTASKGLNIVKAVYMEVNVAPEQKRQEAEYIIELCKQ